MTSLKRGGELVQDKHSYVSSTQSRGDQEIPEQVRHCMGFAAAARRERVHIPEAGATRAFSPDRCFQVLVRGHYGATSHNHPGPYDVGDAEARPGRIYWPKTEALEGRWEPPAVQKVG